MNALICVGNKKLTSVLIIITYYLVQIPRSLTIILNIFIDFQPEDLWSIDSQKNSKFDATRCQILRLKYTKFDFRWGSAQTPPGELTALPRPLAVFKGA